MAYKDKMTFKDVLHMLDYNFDFCPEDCTERCKECTDKATKMVVKAVEKQIPLPPYDKKFETVVISYCPRCGNDIELRPNFCSECGQAIYWED